jgi:hypothetical protein
MKNDANRIRNSLQKYIGKYDLEQVWPLIQTWPMYIFFSKISLKTGPVPYSPEWPMVKKKTQKTIYIQKQAYILPVKCFTASFKKKYSYGKLPHKHKRFRKQMLTYNHILYLHLIYVG